MNKRQIAMGFLAGAVGLSLSGGGAGAGVTEEEARAAVSRWLEALRRGEPAVVEKVLAPEFQILRADGSGYDRKGYLGALPKFASDPKISNFVFTGEGDLLVARYVLKVEQTIKSKPVQAVAPRLSVLRRGPAGWLMVAHANFAQIGVPRALSRI